MNTATIIGNLTRDIELRYTGTQTAVCAMTVAVQRPKRNGEAQGADFISVKCFGKTAEVCEKYLSKGSMVGITGHIQTGSYEKQDGTKVYTTDIIADKVDFLGKPKHENPEKNSEDVQNEFQALDEDVPF